EAITIHAVATSSTPSPFVGPAIPVVAIAKSVLKSLQQLTAMLSATSILTTVHSSIKEEGTPRICVFSSVLYGTILPRKKEDAPASEVICSAIAPPEQLSARLKVCFF